MPRAFAAFALLAFLLAGCAAAEDQDDGPVTGDRHAHGDDHMGATPFRFEATGCVEGGGHSVHPKLPQYLPEPWLPADVQEDTGTPPLTTEFWAHPDEPLPEDNNTMGNWHVTMMCASSSLDGRGLTDHVFGYVGMRVEVPPFDTGTPAERHYLVTVVASNDATFREILHHQGVHATDATGHIGEREGGVWHNILDTADHGVYESYWVPEPSGTMPASYRLWFQKDNGDGTFSPVALDVTNEGGVRQRAAGFYGTFTHLETQDHAPLPGAGGECPAVAYTGFTRTITPGPAPNVTLAEAYIHT